MSGGWREEAFDKIGEDVLAAVVGALSDTAELVLEEANRTAPIEEATLTRSGTAEVNVDLRRTRRPQATVSYDTPYAVKQHEDTRLRHDPGRRAKWLELTMHEQRGPAGEIIANRLREVMGK